MTRLTAAEERSLIERWQNHRDHAARDRLLRAQIRYVQQQVSRFAPWHCREDAFAEACLGVLDAIDRFDLARGCRLSTLAGWHVRTGIQRAVAASRLVRVPRHTADAARGHSSQHVEPETLAAAERALGGDYVDLDDARIGEHGEDEEVTRLDRERVRSALRAALAKLDKRAAELIRRRFGNEETLPEIGAVLGVSRQRVQQIEKRVVGMLRAEMGAG